jgi:predicted GTPase
LPECPRVAETARNVPPKVARARSSLGRKIQLGASPEAVKAARDELAEANAEADVASWPPLSAEARARIACAILSAGTDA